MVFLRFANSEDGAQSIKPASACIDTRPLHCRVTRVGMAVYGTLLGIIAIIAIVAVDAWGQQCRAKAAATDRVLVCHVL